MKTISLVCKSFLLTGICVLVCQSWTLPETTNSLKDQKPEAVLCGLTPVVSSQFKYVATVSQLTDMDSFCVQYASKIKPRIIGYNMIIVPKSGYMEQVNCSVNRFNDVVKSLMKKLHFGDIVVFDGIKALDINGKEIKLDPISVSLK